MQIDNNNNNNNNDNDNDGDDDDDNCDDDDDDDDDDNNATELDLRFSSFFLTTKGRNQTNPVLPGEQSMGLSFNTSSRRKLGSQCSNILTFFNVSKFTWMAISARKLSLSC